VLTRILLRAGTLKVPLSAIGALAVTRAHESFAKEESPEGQPWQALTQEYVGRPKKEGGRGGEAHPILFRTGRGEASIQYSADDTSVAVGSNRKFPGGKSALAIHQLGGVAGRGAKIPARPFLGMNQQDEERAGGILMEYLAGL